jgi:hypothetical protein
MFSLQQNWITRGCNRFCQEVGAGERERREEMVQTMYTHMSKCKNDKINTHTQIK